MKKLLLLIGYISLSAIISISAQDFANEGTWEVGGNISWSSITRVHDGESSENSLSYFVLEVPIYYFVMRGFELGIVPAYESMSYGESSASAFHIYLAPAWNFDTHSNAYPFIEGRIGYNSAANGDTESGMAWAIIGGVKVQIGGGALIRFNVGYSQRTLQESDHEGGRDGENVIGVGAGFSVFFGK